MIFSELKGVRQRAAIVSEIYNWFTEGFDTADLKEAKGLLDELGRFALNLVVSGAAVFHFASWPKSSAGARCDQYSVDGIAELDIAA